MALARELGMHPLTQRAVTPQEQSSLRNLTPVYPDGLSQREVDRSNRDIAGELIISLGTVARHVSNLFAKTGVANRTEAANYAARRRGHWTADQRCHMRPAGLRGTSKGASTAHIPVNFRRIAMKYTLQQTLPDTLDYLVTLSREGIQPEEAKGRLRLKWTPLSRPKIGQDKRSRTFSHPL